jgi:hypothetical protein
VPLADEGAHDPDAGDLLAQHPVDLVDARLHRPEARQHPGDHEADREEQRRHDDRQDPPEPEVLAQRHQHAADHHDRARDRDQAGHHHEHLDLLDVVGGARDQRRCADLLHLAGREGADPLEQVAPQVTAERGGGARAEPGGPHRADDLHDRDREHHAPEPPDQRGVPGDDAVVDDRRVEAREVEHREHADERRHRFNHQEARRGFLGKQEHPRQRENRDHVEERKAGERREGAGQDDLPFRPHRFGERRGFERLVLEQCGIFGRDDDAQPGEERDDVDREGDEEGIAPAPVEEILRGQRRDQEHEEQAGDDQAERRAELRDHRIPAALARRRIDREQRGKPVPRSAERHALAHAEQREEQRGAYTDRFIAGQEGDRRGRSAEQEQRGRQLCAAAIGAVDRGEDHRADGTRDEGKREDCEGPERPLQRIELRKNQLREHEHRCDRIDEEVEKFRRARPGWWWARYRQTWVGGPASGAAAGMRGGHARRDGASRVIGRGAPS